MVAVIAAAGSDRITILGHGLSVPEPFLLLPGITVSPEVPDLDDLALSKCCKSIRDRAAVATMHAIATFSLQIEDPVGGKQLATTAWNRLWDFHLLSLASGSPCFMLYSVSEGDDVQYSVVNRNYIINPFETVSPITLPQLQWARGNLQKFVSLVKDARFASAMRYYGNSHYLFDYDARIMLLWAGIEGLLDVDAELSRRIALYAAIMFDGTPDEKSAYFAGVRKAYGLRSRVVHGSKPTLEKLREGYEGASEILARLLAKCVELGSVPTASRLDEIAVSQSMA